MASAGSGGAAKTLDSVFGTLVSDQATDAADRAKVAADDQQVAADTMVAVKGMQDLGLKEVAILSSDMSRITVASLDDSGNLDTSRTIPIASALTLPTPGGPPAEQTAGK